MTSLNAIESVALNLAQAIDLTMDPLTTQLTRLEAQTTCDEFKAQSPLCDKVGFYLANGAHFSLPVRHFGLELVENSFKLKWDFLAEAQRINLKGNAIQVLQIGIATARDDTLLPLRPALARVIVEMMNRECPERWSNLVMKLSYAISLWKTQTNLVLLILHVGEVFSLLGSIESPQLGIHMDETVYSHVDRIFRFVMRQVDNQILKLQTAQSRDNSQGINRALLTLLELLEDLLKLLSALLEKLLALWGTRPGIERPAKLDIMIEFLMLFMQHPSLRVMNEAALIWLQLLRHRIARKDTVVVNRMFLVIKAVATRLTPCPYPEDDEVLLPGTIQYYMRLEFDKETFERFFESCRSTLLEVVRWSAIVQPEMIVTYCKQWMQMRLRQAHLENCGVNDPINLNWENLASILSVDLHVEDTHSLELLDQYLDIDTEDPLIHAIIIRCIISECVVLDKYPANKELIDRVLYKFFWVWNLSPDLMEDETLASVIRAVQLKAGGQLLKISRKYSNLLLSFLEPLQDQIKNLCSEMSVILQYYGQLERESVLHRVCVLLLGTLSIISNEFCDFECQSMIIEQLMRSIQKDWNRFRQASKSPHIFMELLGLTGTVVTNAFADSRQRILNALSITGTIVELSMRPIDALNGKSICQHVLPLISHVFRMMRVLNKLFMSKNISVLLDEYYNDNFMQQEQIDRLLNVPLSTEKSIQTGFEEAQSFLHNLTEGCYHLLGLAADKFGYELYRLPNLANSIIRNIFGLFSKIPDHRLRMIFRLFLRPFICSCPLTFNKFVLLPVFAHLTPLMYARLSQRWLSSSSMSVALNNPNVDKDEVVKDLTMRLLSREYLDILMVAVHAVETGSNERHSMTSIVSVLGDLLLRNTLIGDSLRMTLLEALSWNDGLCNTKAIPLVKAIIQFQCSLSLIDKNKAITTFKLILDSLQVHGQDDLNHSQIISLGVLVYKKLRPKFRALKQILFQLPNANADYIEIFDKIILKRSFKRKVNCSKTELFVKITKPSIDLWSRDGENDE